MKNRLILVCLLSLLGICLTAQHADAKDLANRLGVGYRNQFSVDLPALAAQYYPSADLGLAAVLGVDTQQNNSKFGFMVRAFRVIFSEDNLNFYMGGAGGVLSNQTNGSATDSGFELQGYCGSEFFFHGLDWLGFSFETGVGITSLSSGVRFRTFGDFPTRAGVTFYF